MDHLLGFGFDMAFQSRTQATFVVPYQLHRGSAIGPRAQPETPKLASTM
jgi:hypothetical protein